MLKSILLLACSFVARIALAQPGTLPLSFGHSCQLPPPDSVDVTGDGIADLVVLGVLGEATCDIPVSYGGCEVVVLALPGTQLLGRLHPMGGRDVHGFARGDTVPAQFGSVRDDLQIPRYAFIDGAVRALTWSYGRNGTAPPRMAPGADRVFVFATTRGARAIYGTFTLKQRKDEHTVRILVGALLTGDEPFVVR